MNTGQDGLCSGGSPWFGRVVYFLSEVNYEVTQHTGN